jgi:hypothetical protein
MTQDPYRDANIARLGGDEALARDMLSGILEPGESLTWAGRPAQGLRLTPSDLVMIPFSLLWGGFAIFWEVSAIVGGAPLLFCLWGIPFVVVGLYLIAGRFFVDAHRRARTFYGLTDTRGLIVVVGSTRKLIALDLAAQKEIQVDEAAGGRGTIHFGVTSQSGSGVRLGRSRGNKDEPPSFEGIPEVGAVYARIRASQRALRKAPDGARVR